MNDVLHDAFRRTDYLVCLGALDWPCIRIGQPLPAVLHRIVGDHSWAFITAWNPGARKCAHEQNDAAQRALLADLASRSQVVVHPAIGIGAEGWYEPSLFVLGPTLPAIVALARQYRQKGFVHGHAAGIARLHLFDE